MALLTTHIKDLANAVASQFNATTPRLLPTGGTTGQALVKNSNAVGDAAFVTVGTALYASTGPAGHALPFLDAANTWSGAQAFGVISIANAAATSLTVTNTIGGSITGNAGSATKLANARALSLVGDVAGSVTFDGTANAAISATMANVFGEPGSYGAVNAIPALTVDAKGRVTALTTYTIGTAAQAFTGASGHVVPFLDGTNTWSSGQSFSAYTNFNGGAYLEGNIGVASGKLTVAAPTTSYASLSLPHGTTPTSLTNGDMWTTTSGVYVYVNGNTIQLNPANSTAAFLSRFIANAGQTTYTLGTAVTTSNSAIVTQNGQRLDPLNDYSVSGTTLTLTANTTVSLNDIIIAEASGGNQGAAGAKGDTGAGMPTGGTTGQLVLKQSNTTGDFGFASIGAGLTIANSVLSAVATASIPATDIQSFNSSGTWTKPAGAKSVYVWAIKGGNGGGGGGWVGSGSANGGSGGQGGTPNDAIYPASMLPPTVTVTVGAGGAGGAYGPYGNSYGYGGGGGGASTFGTYLTSPLSLSPFVDPSCAGSGGSGGGSADTYGNNGNSGTQGSVRRGAPNGAGVGGAYANQGSANSGSSATVDVAINEPNGGSGGGGGSGAANAGFAPNGGNGAAPGGGGGGGGGGTQSTGGGGGAGAPGRVVVITFF